jgi:hypothetical protein
MNIFSKFCEIKTMVCLCLFLHILVGIIPKTASHSTMYYTESKRL